METTDGNRILIIDDEENMRHMLKVLLEKNGYHVDTAADGAQGLEIIQTETYDFILCDIKMPNLNGMEFLKKSGSNLQQSTVIMMSAYGSIETAIEAMKLGAYDYISKPFKTDEVLMALRKAEERERLKRENIRLKERIKRIEENYRFGNMIAKSKSMLAVFRLAEKVARYNTTVLITGESGTGKELVARGIHFMSDRADHPMIPVNCGGIPETLLESEFFGYKKGAFTGADKNKKGLFEEAEGGSLFLDEIGELPLTLQVKLLRVLQENEVRQIGDARPKTVDVRVIAATAKNLDEEVKTGRFRQDLFYRLNVVPVEIPPLRNRVEDIPYLCEHFVKKYNKALEKNIGGISPEALTRLETHRWPGNVRELENAIERAIVLADTRFLQIDDFPSNIGKVKTTDHLDEWFDGDSLKDAQKMLEKTLITRALQKTSGNRTKASQLLEISHPSLLSKIKQYNIDL